jgi:GTP-binding protein
LKISSAEFARSGARAEDLIDDGAMEVAFVGRSNVGKSSLLNKLLGVKLARTSSTPGRTQTVNYFRINRKFWFVDLPGYGYAKAARSDRERWAKVVESYLERDPSRRLLVQLVDAKVGATPLDAQAAEYFAALGIRRILVATKADKLKRGERSAALAGIRTALAPGEEAVLLPVSAVSGEGMRELWKSITDFLAGQIPPES